MLGSVRLWSWLILLRTTRTSFSSRVSRILHGWTLVQDKKEDTNFVRLRTGIRDCLATNHTC